MALARGFQAIDPENAFPAQRTPGPYFTVPSWWRSFLFSTMSTRTVVVYLYLCSMMNERGTAFPLRSQIAEDLGIKNRQTVVSSIDELERLGLLLRERRELPSGGKRSQRTIYQRPSIEYTLLTLLDRDIIDQDLMPTRSELPRAAMRRRHERAVLAGLKNLTDMRDYVDRYAVIDDPAKKMTALRWLLKESLERKRRAAAIPDVFS